MQDSMLVSLGDNCPRVSIPMSCRGSPSTHQSSVKTSAGSGSATGTGESGTSSHSSRSSIDEEAACPPRRPSIHRKKPETKKKPVTRVVSTTVKRRVQEAHIAHEDHIESLQYIKQKHTEAGDHHKAKQVNQKLQAAKSKIHEEVEALHNSCEFAKHPNIEAIHKAMEELQEKIDALAALAEKEIEILESAGASEGAQQVSGSGELWYIEIPWDGRRFAKRLPAIEVTAGSNYSVPTNAFYYVGLTLMCCEQCVVAGGGGTDHTRLTEATK